MDEIGRSCQERLERRTRREVTKHGNPYRAAEHWGVSSAHFHNVLNEGMDSPTLRRKWGINKTSRRRFCCEDPDGTIAAMVDAAAQGRGMTRGELLTWLLEECE